MADFVEVYGGNHSPWVQAVLLGLHNKQIHYKITQVPPWETFNTHGILMPAARFDHVGTWQLESADILHRLGYDEISDEDKKMVQQTWQGVLQRANSTALFWGGLSIAGHDQGSLLECFFVNFIRSFSALYFYVLVRILAPFFAPKDPDNYGDQYVPINDRLVSIDTMFLGGESPNTIDFLLLGIVQCHSSIYVPTVSALQSDERLAHVRGWISDMQRHFHDYPYLYSGVYFPPHSPRPKSSIAFVRFSFWLGLAFFIACFPISVPVILFLIIREHGSTL